MTKLHLILTFCFLTFVTVVRAQKSSYTSTGNVGFEIKLRGHHPSFDNIQIISAHGVLLSSKIFNAKPQNDSVLAVSCYNFGPTSIVIKIFEQYFYTFILPGQKDTLIINFSDPERYTLNYNGYFKEIFDFSNKMGEVIKEASAYSNLFFDRKDGYKFFVNSYDFKNSRLERVDSIILKFGDNYSSAIIDQHVKLYLGMHYKRLMMDFPLAITSANRNIDSLRATKVPKRDLTYYNGIVEKEYGDTTSLISFQHYRFIHDLLLDPLLKLPSLKAGANAYHKALKATFGRIFGNGENLFYDLALANAYVSQINEGILLTTAQIREISSFYKNKEMSKYIIYENNEKSKLYAKQINKQYLPFEKTRIDVMHNILEKYKGKVILMDFWATWCGPCLAGFEEFKMIKESYKDSQEVVFVYMTDQTSNYAQWNNFVAKLGGEHYYLYNNQSDKISANYGFNSIPTYLVFDRQGKLAHKSVGLNGDEKDKAKEWIEKALKQ